MRINYQSSGGYLNLSLEYQADTDDLPKDVADDLQQLVAQAKFFDIKQGELADPNSGPPDVIRYRLTVTVDNLSQSITCNDVTAPQSLRALLGRLQDLALQSRTKAT